MLLCVNRLGVWVRLSVWVSPDLAHEVEEDGDVGTGSHEGPTSGKEKHYLNIRCAQEEGLSW